MIGSMDDERERVEAIRRQFLPVAEERGCPLYAGVLKIEAFEGNLYLDTLGKWLWLSTYTKDGQYTSPDVPPGPLSNGFIARYLGADVLQARLLEEVRP